MKEIKKVQVYGLSAYIDDPLLKPHFETKKQEYSRVYGGPNHGKTMWHTVTQKMYKSKPRKGFYAGLGGIQWLNKHSEDLEFDIVDYFPARGPITEPLLVPEALSSSPKFKVNGKERFYFFEALEACFKNPQGTIKLPTGCHAKDTKVVMFDGSLKKVQDVKVGDLLMGPDSTPRTVQKLYSGYTDKMYKVTPKRGGDPFICNGDHVLSLKVTRGAKDKRYPDGSIQNISIENYLQQTKTYKHTTKLYRTGVEFESQPVEFDPYMVGCYLADGSKLNPQICCHKTDLEIREFIKDFAKNNGLLVNEYKEKGNCTSLAIRTLSNYKNPFREFIKTLLTKNYERYIPIHYLVNSRESRLQLLAGLLDCDGYLYNNCFEFVAKDKCFAEQVQFLVRSLGFTCSLVEKIGTIKELNFEGVYYRLHISGNTDEIPTLLPRKQAKSRRQIKDNKVTGFDIEELPGDNYYGFNLDKDNLYLLDNFIVTHNSGKTEIQLTLAYNHSTYIGTGMILVPTLIIKDQFIERGTRYGLNIIDYNEWAPNSPKDTIVVTTHHVICEKLKDKARKKVAQEELNKIDWILCDEVAHSTCASWFDILMNLDNCQRCHGFSALPVAFETENGKCFDDLDTDDARVIGIMGEVLYEKSANDLRDFLNLPELINIKYEWPTSHPDFKKDENWDKMRFAKDWQKMRKAIVMCDERTLFIAKIMKYLVTNGYKTATFVNQKDHAREILEYIQEPSVACWFGGGEAFTLDGKIEQDYIKDEFGTDLLGLILTSFAIEGLDFDNPLNVLVLHEGKSVRQTVQKSGRVVRVDDKASIILNICDRGCNILPKHANIRAGDIINEFGATPINCSTFNQFVEELQIIEEKRNEN